MLACETCADSRDSTARFAVTFSVLAKGGTPQPVKWCVCGECLPSCVEAAYTQYRPEFGRPHVSLLKRTYA